MPGSLVFDENKLTIIGLHGQSNIKPQRTSGLGNGQSPPGGTNVRNFWSLNLTTRHGKQVVVRLQPPLMAAIDAWIAEQLDPRPTRALHRFATKVLKMERG